MKKIWSQSLCLKGLRMTWIRVMAPNQRENLAAELLITLAEIGTQISPVLTIFSFVEAVNTISILRAAWNCKKNIPPALFSPP